MWFVLVPVTFGLLISVRALKLDLSSQRWRFSNGVLEGDAKIPGDIFSDLHRNGLIENPYYGNHDQDLQWVSRVSWRYSSHLNLSDEILKVPIRLYLTNNNDITNSGYVSLSGV